MPKPLFLFSPSSFSFIRFLHVHMVFLWEPLSFSRWTMFPNIHGILILSFIWGKPWIMLSMYFATLAPHSHSVCLATSRIFPLGGVGKNGVLSSFLLISSLYVLPLSFPSESSTYNLCLPFSHLSLRASIQCPASTFYLYLESCMGLAVVSILDALS